VRVWRRAHAKSAQKFRERIAKFPEFGMPLAEKLRALGQHALRKPYNVTEALDRSIMHLDPKIQMRGVEITQILCENLANELQNFRNFGAPCAERIACTRPAFAAKNIVTSLQSAVRSD